MARYGTRRGPEIRGPLQRYPLTLCTNYFFFFAAFLAAFFGAAFLVAFFAAFFAAFLAMVKGLIQTYSLDRYARKVSHKEVRTTDR